MTNVTGPSKVLQGPDSVDVSGAGDASGSGSAGRKVVFNSQWKENCVGGAKDNNGANILPPLQYPVQRYKLLLTACVVIEYDITGTEQLKRHGYVSEKHCT